MVVYDGTEYRGWQRQRDELTVQELLEAALDRATGTVVGVRGSGRTDAGVHADGQVIAFDSRTRLPADAVRHRTAHLLPRDVQLVRLERAHPSFDPQRDAVAKCYRYTVLRAPAPSPSRERCAFRVDSPLDVDAMRRAAGTVVGRHDFRSFRTDPGPARRDEDTVRTVRSVELHDLGESLVVDVAGEGFLYMMVRNLVAGLLAVGRGDWGTGRMAEVLAACDRRLVPPPAPAHGLCLRGVTYDDGFASGPV